MEAHPMSETTWVDTSDPTKSRTFCYARVSTYSQHEDGYGLDAQREACQRYITYKQLPQPIPAFVDEPVSAMVPFLQRKAGRDLHFKLQRGDHLVIAKLDRAFRDTEDTLYMNRQWKDLGVIVHYLDMNCDTSTPFGEFMLTLNAAFAKMERRKIGERTMEALAALRRK